MEKPMCHVHSNLSKIKSYGRNRRQNNTTNISENQQRIQQQVNTNTIEFQKKVEMLQQKMKEVRSHVKQTKNRLNSFHRNLD
ncbi:MAG TPA: hypothetical protein DDW50_19565 [Firmicutes bacterium]|jgi:peptidoglycan hydrolase CwlO-like protein|nr:hypothetical protein [Bacillota bacterium]